MLVLFLSPSRSISLPTSLPASMLAFSLCLCLSVSLFFFSLVFLPFLSLYIFSILDFFLTTFHTGYKSRMGEFTVSLSVSLFCLSVSPCVTLLLPLSIYLLSFFPRLCLSVCISFKIFFSLSPHCLFLFSFSLPPFVSL